MTSKIKMIATVTVLVLGTVKAVAAGRPNTDSLIAAREMAMLRIVLYDTTHLSFHGLFCCENADSVTVRDTMNIQYQVSRYKYRIVIDDSLEVVQNNFYNLVLYHDRDMAILSRPLDLFKYLFHGNLNDTAFWRLYVNKMTVADTGSYRKLSYQFKPGSPYEKFEILYDAASYHIHSIQYLIRKYPFTAGSPGGDGSYRVNILFSSYQTGTFTDQVFSTDPFFIHRQGLYQMVSPYTNYELINSLNQ